jgi:hypothetical protein
MAPADGFVAELANVIHLQKIKTIISYRKQRHITGIT